MTVRVAFQIALVAVSAALVMMMVGIAIAKGVREHVDARRFALAAEVRPAVLTALDTGLDKGTAVLELTGRRRAVAESIAISLLPKLRGADRQVLATLLDDGGVLDQAIKGLGSHRASRRQRAAELLGSAGHLPAGRQLADLLRDRDVGVRMAAARALGRLGDERAVTALFVAHDDGRLSSHATSMAVLRIGATADSEIMTAMKSWLPGTRVIAVELAGSLGLNDARGQIEVLLDDPEVNVQTSAARALGRLGVPDSVDVLISRLERELAGEGVALDLAVAIVVSLGQIGHRRAIPLLQTTLMCRHRLSAAAAAALATMGNRRPQNGGRREPFDPSWPQLFMELDVSR